MRRSRRPIVIASRRSRLARAQAELVGAALGRLHAGIEVRYEWIESEGDRDPRASLADSGGKGLFVRAIEQALLAGRADIAVHSLKDLPTQATAGLTIAAIPARAEVRDCLITRSGAQRVEDLPHGAVLGTSGPRRAAQVRRLRPDVVVKPMRGNVETRLAKVLGAGDADGAHGNGNSNGNGEPHGLGEGFDATLLAAAGLRRAGLGPHAAVMLDVAVVLPAAGQGALAIQCRQDDHVSITRCLPLNDATTAACVHAERAVVAALQGDCHSPIAVYAQRRQEGKGERYLLRARVLSPDGVVCLEAEAEATPRMLTKAARGVADDLLGRGAAEVMRGAIGVTAGQG